MVLSLAFLFLIVFNTICVQSVMATPPTQARGAHTSSGGDDYGEYRYLAEGYTGFTSNYVAIFNLHGDSQTVENLYTDENGYSWKKTFNIGVGGNRRATREINSDIGVKGRSIATRVKGLSGSLMAERSSYVGYEGTSSSGTHSPTRGSWYFPEGYTGHDLYIAVRNCSDNQQTFHFMFYLTSGFYRDVTKTVRRSCRGTIRVNDFVPSDRDVAIELWSTGPFTAERSSLAGNVATSSSGHRYMGNSEYLHAEGYGSFSTYISMANISGWSTTGTAAFFDSQGRGATRSIGIPQNSRRTIRQDVFGSGVDFSTITASSGPDIAFSSERSSYYGSWGTSSEGTCCANAVVKRVFAEGYTGHDTYIAVCNASDVSDRTKFQINFYVRGSGVYNGI